MPEGDFGEYLSHEKIYTAERISVSPAQSAANQSQALQLN
jgi:hypothetical protein